MIILETKLYSFEELSPEAKETAIESNRYRNVEHEEWWEFTSESVSSFFATVGLDVTVKYFDLDRDKGTSCEVDFDKPFSEVVSLIESKAWLANFPTIETPFSRMAIVSKGATPSRIDYFFTEFIYGGLRPRDRGIGTYSEACEGCEVEGKWRVSSVCREIIDIMDKLASDIDSLATKWLEEEYDYLTSDDCIAEGLSGTGEIFLETGREF